MCRALLKFRSFDATQATIPIFWMAMILGLSPSASIAGDGDNRFAPDGRSTQLAALAPNSTASAGNQPGYDVFAELLRNAQPGENLLISPHSLAVALAIVANGADGETAAAFRKVLHEEGLEADAAAAAQHSLQQSLAHVDPAITLPIANALWGDRTVKFNAGYIAGAKDNYGAEVASVDFAAPATLKRINAWASDHTSGI
jgi:serine protease inhibitor